MLSLNRSGFMARSWTRPDTRAQEERYSPSEAHQEVGQVDKRRSKGEANGHREKAKEPTPEDVAISTAGARRTSRKLP